MLAQYFSTQDAQMKRLTTKLEHNKQMHQSSIQELELKIKHLNWALAKRPPNQFPSNMDVNPKGKENVMTIFLCSGKQLEESKSKGKEKEVTAKNVEEEKALLMMTHLFPRR